MNDDHDMHNNKNVIFFHGKKSPEIGDKAQWVQNHHEENIRKFVYEFVIPDHWTFMSAPLLFNELFKWVNNFDQEKLPDRFSDNFEIILFEFCSNDERKTELCITTTKVF